MNGIILQTRVNNFKFQSQFVELFTQLFYDLSSIMIIQK